MLLMFFDIVKEERRKKLVILLRIEKGLYKYRAFMNVNEEGIRGPTTHESYQRRRHAMFCKGSSATSPHRLTNDIEIGRAHV